MYYWKDLLYLESETGWIWLSNIRYSQGKWDKQNIDFPCMWQWLLERIETLKTCIRTVLVVSKEVRHYKNLLNTSKKLSLSHGVETFTFTFSLIFLVKQHNSLLMVSLDLRQSKHVVINYTGILWYSVPLNKEVSPIKKWGNKFLYFIERFCAKT